jgi:hypothetical protein
MPEGLHRRRKTVSNQQDDKQGDSTGQVRHRNFLKLARHRVISSFLNFVQVSVKLSGMPSTFSHWETPEELDGYPLQG